MRRSNPEKLRRKINGLSDIVCEIESEAQLEQMGPYHFRFHGTQRNVDIYPTTNRYWYRGLSEAIKYHSEEELKEILLNNR